MNYTEEQLKAALAKMLPDILTIITKSIWWSNNTPEHPYPTLKPVLDTELLHLCWMVEETLTLDEWNEFKNTFENILSWCIFPINFMHSTWQQRVIALAVVKKIEIA